MSNVYVTEPPTRGKVLLKTSHGDIDVELWPKEAPKAVRNFIQLIMEGYYGNEMIFHRIIKGLFVQTGDPTGTGKGGESVYGGYFPDEFHPRLRFNHRGQLAMANLNVPNTNTSQFFITLDKCPWLDKQHTIFGKVTGNTIFNLLRMGDMEVDKDDRPLEPPRLLGIDILDNPFDDVVPRSISRAPATKTATQAAASGPRNATKPSKVQLSFHGDDEEEVEGGKGAVSISRVGKIRSAHEVLAGPGGVVGGGSCGMLAAEVREEDAEYLRSHDHPQGGASSGVSAAGSKRSRAPATGAGQEETAVANAQVKRARHEEHFTSSAGSDVAVGASGSDAAAEFNRVRAQLLDAKRAVQVLTGDALAKSDAAASDSSLLTPLQQLRTKYKKKPDAGRAREASMLERLAKFKETLHGALAPANADEDAAAVSATGAAGYSGQLMETESTAEDEAGWMAHKLRFKRHIDDKYRGLSGPGGQGADDGLMTIDPMKTRPGNDSLKSSKL